MTVVALRIAYFGLPLGALLLGSDGHELSFCAVPPIDAPGLRRVKRLYQGRILEAFSLGDALDEEVAHRLAEEPPDLLVSWFWTRKLPPEWLAAPRLGALGVHPSLLPRHRGPNPYFWAIDSGDLETGVSVHRLEAEYDTGAVLEQERIPIRGRNAWQLARALDRPSLRCLRRTVAAATRGLPAGTEQNAELATLAPEPQGELLRADFKWPTERVLRRIRALSPVPGLALSIADVAFFVTQAHPSVEFTRALLPGEAEIAQGRLVIRTGDTAIAVETGVLLGEDDDSEEVSGAELAEHMAHAISLARGSSLKGNDG